MVQAVRQNHHKQTEVLQEDQYKHGQVREQCQQEEEEGRGETLTNKRLGKTNRSSPIGQDQSDAI